ncbi:MAG: glycoside hydrolase family 19 protein [Thainema sp.]
MTQLDTWRNLAAGTLDSLIRRINSSTFTVEDGLVDNLLRILAGQPPRPLNRDPYVGLFGAGSVANLRSRAASGVRVYLEQLDALNLVKADEEADRLIRELRNFPTERPTGVLPYESLFGYTDTNISESQIELWRRQAANRLQSLIADIASSTPVETDFLADSLLRALSSQPARPADRDPYRGLILLPESTPFREYRLRAADALKIYIDSIDEPKLGSKDAVIDDVIRKVTPNPLPSRPINRLPYEGLFPTATGITAAQLRQIAPEAPADVEKFISPINVTIAEFDINTPLRQAHFLAQIAHESGGFRFVEELASGDQYEGRLDLGNTQPGDGRRFKGRGLIQITGRSNYTACSLGLGLNNALINQPDLLERSDLAARSAGWYWNSRGINRFADRDDLNAVTRAINGGLTNIEDRALRLSRAKRLLGI